VQRTKFESAAGDVRNLSLKARAQENGLVQFA